MVFWSSFAKKVKQAVSQVSFDALKTRVSNVEQTNQTQDTKINVNQQNITQLQSTTTQHTQSINTNTSNISNNSNKITNVDNKVDSVIRGLQNGNIVNYEGVYSSSKTYHLAQAITYKGDWFVSNIDNNLNHTPTKSNTNYWVYISAPNVDLNLYLTKSEAHSTYATQNELNVLQQTTISSLNNLDNRLTNTNTSINNLQSAKADKTQLNNFYNKQQINSFNLTTLIGKITNISVGPQYLGVGNYGIIKMAFDTDISVNPNFWNDIAVIDFYFVNSGRNRTWVKPVFVNLVNSNKIGIEFFTPDANSYVNHVGTGIAIRVIKNQNYIV